MASHDAPCRELVAADLHVLTRASAEQIRRRMKAHRLLHHRECVREPLEVFVARRPSAEHLVELVLDASAHGAVLARPDLLDGPALLDETTELIVRYLQA